MKQTILAALFLAAATASSANAQCYLFTSSTTGVSLKVDITTRIGTIGPINSGNTRSTNYTFLAINIMTIGGSTQVSSGFGQGSELKTPVAAPVAGLIVSMYWLS